MTDLVRNKTLDLVSVRTERAQLDLQVERGRGRGQRWGHEPPCRRKQGRGRADHLGIAADDVRVSFDKLGRDVDVLGRVE